MNIFKTALFVFAVSLPMMSKAALVSSNHEVYGDNKITTDTTTGIEWLSLDVTKGMSLNDAKDFIANSGGVWRLPNENEVAHYIQELVKHDDSAFGTDPDSALRPIQTSDTSAILTNINKLGISYQSGDDIYSIGFHTGVINGEEVILSSGFYGRFLPDTNTYFGRSGAYAYGATEANLDAKVPQFGVFLVSADGFGGSNINDVPSPFSALLLLPTFFMLTRNRRHF